MREQEYLTKWLFFVGLLLMVVCTPVAGGIIYVDDDAVGGNNGLSWADAYTYLQDALADANMAEKPVEIRVAQGIYTPTQDPLDRDATFDLKDGVSIIGGYAGLAGMDPDLRRTQAFVTILSGDIDHNDDSIDQNNKEGNSRHVMMCTGESNAAVLEGVTITGGYAARGRPHNYSDGLGGGLYYLGASPQLIDCVFKENYAGGGAVYVSSGSHPVFTRCIWEDNEAESVGAAIYAQRSSYLIRLNHCVFRRNTAGSRGGAIYVDLMGEVRMVNCLFAANTANDSGGAISYPDFNDGTGRSLLNLVNCTFYGNTSPAFYKPPTNSAKQPDGSWVRTSGSVITNCIFYNSVANEMSDMPVSFKFGSTEPLIITSIYEREPELGGEGRLPPMPDPLFVDPFGADDILGTEDDDFRLAPGSSAVDTGTNDTDPPLSAMDLDGNPRIISDRIDMGAYEFQGVIYVGGDIPDNPRGYGTENDPMSNIQEAIDIAKNGYTVLVRPGVYGKIDFTGKAITVTGTEGAAVIMEPWNGRAGAPRPDAVTFHTGEGLGSVLKNFIIKGAGAAISLNYESRPTIRNITVVDNTFGIAAYENANPDISNCIFWNNKDGNLFQCDVRYSCVEGGAPGEGNISVEPLFVDAANGDYHLRSEGWRWSSYTETWTYDDVTSRCVDAGNPASALGDELMSVPRDPNNRYGVNMRINMGAFGGTIQASMPPSDWAFPEYERTPPEPNPSLWALAGAPREVASEDGLFSYYAQMTAVEATDASGWVEYFFECTTDSGFSSDWQSSPTYSVRLGRGGQGQRFRVKARDLYANETAWSEELPAN
ncbi:right-handed parallel beta-helix repeat-containing protein [Planctomycetota bacterium]